MHKLSIAFAGVVLASLAGLADGRVLIYLARPNTGDEQFRHDRDRCIARATVVDQGGCSTQMGWTGNSTGPANGPPMAQRVTTCYTPRFPTRSISAPEYTRCMLAKGYQQSAPSLPAGKAGLYELRRFSNLAIFAGRDLSSTPPYTQRRASADAMARPGAVFQLCLQQDGAQQLGAVAGLSPSCTYSDITPMQRGFSADASCPGGQRMRVTLEENGPDHREFTVIGQPMHRAAVPHIEKYQFNWISPNCGDVPPGAVRMPDGKLITMASPKPMPISFGTNLP